MTLLPTKIHLSVVRVLNSRRRFAKTAELSKVQPVP